MIDKPIIIMAFLYGTSFMLLGTQYMLGDTFGITMTNFEGEPITPNVLSILDSDTFNTITNDVVQTNQTTIATNPVIAAAEMGVGMFQLLTGTYVFNLLAFFGIPVIVVAGFSGLYAIFLIRSIMAYLRGI